MKMFSMKNHEGSILKLKDNTIFLLESGFLQKKNSSVFDKNDKAFLKLIFILNFFLKNDVQTFSMSSSLSICEDNTNYTPNLS